MKAGKVDRHAVAVAFIFGAVRDENILSGTQGSAGCERPMVK